MGAEAADAPDIPEDQRPPLDELPDSIQGPFFQEIGQRKAQGRDAKILVTAKDGQTGIGKSNFSDFLAYVCDTSARGFGPSKTTIDPQEFLRFYNVLPAGSASVLEEGEQFDARRAMAQENVDASHTWMMARIREIVAILNLPSRDAIDKRLERLADYWIDVKRRGFAVVYKKRIHPITGKIYYEKLQTIEWPNMEGSDSFRAMAGEKDDKLDDDGPQSNLVPEEKVQERVERARREGKMEKRDDLIAAMYKEADLRAQDIAGLSEIDVSEGRIRQIAGPKDD